MVDTQALNKELAEWAGWHSEVASMGDGMRYPILLSPDEELVEGQAGYIPDHTPNFTNSLDACFEWLVPKLTDLDINARLVLTHQLDYSVSIFFSNPVDDDYPTRGVGRGRDGESPALALCLAIEKLIDEK